MGRKKKYRTRILEPRVQVTLMMPKSMRDTLVELCEREQRSKGACIRMLVMQYFAFRKIKYKSGDKEYDKEYKKGGVPASDTIDDDI